MGIRKVMVLTSGGDAPAMNAAVYSFALASSLKGIEVYGAVDGYKGLIDSNYKKIDVDDFKKNIYLSGTFIGSSRCLAFKELEARKMAIDALKKKSFDALFVIGGDGSYMGASLINDLNFPVVAAPGTIDNDVASSRYTIGYFSALEEIFQAVKKIKSTSDSHSQITFVEVMGRHCHDLSVAASLAAGVDYVITNKSIKKESELFHILKEMIERGRRGIVVLVTEKVYGPSFGFGLPSLPDLCASLEKKLDRQVRFNVLGYTQRGAQPTSWDLYVAQCFGIKAFELIESGKTGLAIGFDGYSFYTTPLSEAVVMTKKTSLDLIEFVNSAYKI